MRNTRSVLTAALGAVVLSGGLVVASVGTAAAADGASPMVKIKKPLTLKVNSTSDTHAVAPTTGKCKDATRKCSLRAAVEVADAATAGRSVTIVLPGKIFDLTLGALFLSHNPVTIFGASQSTTIVSAQGNSQVLGVASGSAVSLDQLELTGGNASTDGGGLANSGDTTLNGVTVTANTAADGGGILNVSGATLTLANSTVSANSVASVADSTPGGNGGGVENQGSLIVSGSTVTGNSAGNGGFGGADTGGSGGNGGGIDNSGTVSVTGSTLSGNAAGSGGIGESGQELSGPGGDGGGIYSSSGSVTLTNSTLSGNKSGYAGPLGEAPYPSAGDGGGVWSSADLQVSGTTFSSNAGETGTGPGGSGGAVFTSGTATITGSTFTGNTGGLGSGGGNGGAIADSGSLTLSGSTLADNTAGSGQESGNGGNGGGLYSSGGSATVTDDTFDANSGGNGGNSIPVDPGCTAPGSGGDGGAVFSSAVLTVTNSTISGNSTGQGGSHVPPCAGQAPNGVGGGLATVGGSASLLFATIAGNSDGIDNLAGTVTLAGSIVSASTGANCTGTVSEVNGYNLDSGTTCGFSQATDLTNADPVLGALASNGGPTQTQALQSGSPAIDHGGTASSGCPTADQRGDPRPDEAGDAGACDIGAYESQGIG